MPHTKTTYVDRNVQFPTRYIDQNLNQLTLTPDPGIVTEAGTPVAAVNMNKLEQVAYLLANTFTLTSSGTDSYALTITGISSLNDLLGIPLKFIANFANSGACTLNANSYGAIAISKDVSAALETGDILANSIVMAVYDGTRFQLLEQNGIVTKNSVSTMANKTLTTPKIVSGGSVNDANNNEYIKLVGVASAVNEITVTNAIAGQPPRMEASGGDTNANLVIDGKGTGRAVDRNGANYIKEGTDILTPTSTVLNTSLKESRSLAHLTIEGASQVGTIKITLPEFTSAVMLAIKITGFNYEGVPSMWELNLSGYAYTTPDSWVTTSATLIGDAPFTTVRFAVDGTGKHCVLLGGLATVWQYPKIVVSEVIAGYSGWALTNVGYTVALIASESGLVVNETPILKRFTSLQADVLDANYTNATSTFNALSNFSQKVIAGKKYKVTGYLKCTNTAPTGTGSLYLPSGSGTLIGRDFKNISMTTIGTAGLSGSLFSLTGAGPEVNIFDAIFTCATSGDLALSANISGGAGTLTILAGSYFTAQEINMV